MRRPLGFLKGSFETDVIQGLLFPSFGAPSGDGVINHDV